MARRFKRGQRFCRAAVWSSVKDQIILDAVSDRALRIGEARWGVGGLRQYPRTVEKSLREARRS